MYREIHWIASVSLGLARRPPRTRSAPQPRNPARVQGSRISRSTPAEKVTQLRRSRLRRKRSRPRLVPTCPAICTGHVLYVSQNPFDRISITRSCVSSPSDTIKAPASNSCTGRPELTRSAPAEKVTSWISTSVSNNVYLSRPICVMKLIREHPQVLRVVAL